MTWALIAAGLVLAYVVPAAVRWRRIAAREWAEVERGLKLRATILGPDRSKTYSFERRRSPEVVAAKAEAERLRDGDRLGKLWLDNPYADPPGRLVVAGMAFIEAALWPLLCGLGATFFVANALAIAVTNPTKAERKRRQLASARENVARLERELGITTEAEEATT